MGGCFEGLKFCGLEAKTILWVDNFFNSVLCALA